MRLIDADVLLEHIKKLECHAENKKYEQGLNDFLQCYLPQIIDNQPTAFDTEKVVEQLGEEGQKMTEAKPTKPYGKSSPSFHRYYKSISVKKAIDIVKKGGMK